MLDRTRDSGGYIEVGADHAPGLPDLMLMIDPAGVDGGARRTDRSADRVSEITNEGEVRRLLQPAAARHDDVRLGNRKLACIRSLRFEQLRLRLNGRKRDRDNLRRPSARLLGRERVRPSGCESRIAADVDGGKRLP